MTSRRRCGFSAVTMIVALIGAVALTGCLQKVPIVSSSDENKTTNMTLDEQRTWVERQFDMGIAASGITSGWYWGSATKVPWSDDTQDRALVLSSWFPRECGLGGRLVETVRMKSETQDFSSIASKVRAQWESDGWTISDVRAGAEHRDPYFRADREDGAVLAFQASEAGISLSVDSACSVNNTVTNWQSYLDDEPNEFDEELDRRAQDGAEPTA